jgi:hypothetical protein
VYNLTDEHLAEIDRALAHFESASLLRSSPSKQKGF